MLPSRTQPLTGHRQTETQCVSNAPTPQKVPSESEAAVNTQDFEGVCKSSIHERGQGARQGEKVNELQRFQEGYQRMGGHKQCACPHSFHYCCCCYMWSGGQQRERRAVTRELLCALCKRKLWPVEQGRYGWYRDRLSLTPMDRGSHFLSQQRECDYHTECSQHLGEQRALRPGNGAPWMPSPPTVKVSLSLSLSLSLSHSFSLSLSLSLSNFNSEAVFH